MTFADRLNELKKAATPRPWVADGSIECAYGWIKAPPDCRDTFGRPYNILHSQYTSQPHDANLIAFLANNADAILELVRAADRACIQRGLDDQHELRQSLAKLNGEQT